MYDALYGTILYNLSCVAANTTHTWDTYLRMLYYCFPLLLMVLASLKGRFGRPMVCFAVLSSVIFLYVYGFGRAYVFAHYYIILAVCIPALFVMAVRRNGCGHAGEPIPGKPVLALFACLFCIGCFTGALTMSRETDLPYLQDAQAQVMLIPQEDRDEVIAYGVGAEWYLKTEILPCGRFFVLQDTQSGQSITPDMADENTAFYADARPKWVVVKDEIGLAGVAAAIEQNYVPADTVRLDEDSTLVLYRRRS